MFKLLNVSFFILFGLLSTSLYAQKTLKLSPNESKFLANNSLWKINATCSIQSSKNGKIKISVLKNSGSVNGKNLSSGQATFVNVRNNSSISVSAESGTQINLINLGNEGLEAVCST